jgi:hypothetical protein
MKMCKVVTEEEDNYFESRRQWFFSQKPTMQISTERRKKATRAEQKTDLYITPSPHTSPLGLPDVRENKLPETENGLLGL